jgi:hypothetical protein
MKFWMFLRVQLAVVCCAAAAGAALTNEQQFSHIFIDPWIAKMLLIALPISMAIKEFGFVYLRFGSGAGD